MSDDNEICNIVTLAGKFKTYSELQNYSDKQFTTLQAAAQKIMQLEAEVSHLKNLLISTTALLPKNPLQISAEEEICEIQIAMLRERSTKQELTLEETKKLDLLIKNKRLAKEQSTTIVADSKKINTNYDNAQLIQIVSKTDES